MDLSEKTLILRHSAYFRSLPEEALARLAATVQERRFRAGQVVFRKGERARGLFIVLAGRVRSLARSPDGRQQVLKGFGPGSTFGDVAVFDGGPLPAETEALADSVVAFLPRDQLLGLLAQHPSASLDVIRLFAGRLRAYKGLVEDLSLRGVVARVAKLLLDRSRGAPTLSEERPTTVVRATHEELASMVGSVREVVQRALKALEADGAIRQGRGRITIVDPRALSAWSESASRKRRAPARTAR